MPGARRQIKLPYTEKRIQCPHCRGDLTIGTVMDKILLSRRTCPKCHKEFVIEKDVPNKPGTAKKPSESVHASRTNKRTKSR
jgi:transposase-like protein